jgi:thiol:disulfide interchange protein
LIDRNRATPVGWLTGDVQEPATAVNEMNLDPPRRGRVAAARAWAARYERWLWTAVIGAMLVVQWPVLKGYYYRAANTEPRVSSIAWRTDLDASLTEARQSGKLVLVDFMADWCPPCIAMKHDVWPDPDVERAVAASYVPVMIDIDRDGRTADRYGVRGIPTILVLDGNGAVVRQGSFFTASRMVRFLEEAR